MDNTLQNQLKAEMYLSNYLRDVTKNIELFPHELLGAQGKHILYTSLLLAQNVIKLRTEMFMAEADDHHNSVSSTNQAFQPMHDFVARTLKNNKPQEGLSVTQGKLTLTLIEDQPVAPQQVVDTPYELETDTALIDSLFPLDIMEDAEKPIDMLCTESLVDRYLGRQRIFKPLSVDPRLLPFGISNILDTTNKEDSYQVRMNPPRFTPTRLSLDIPTYQRSNANVYVESVPQPSTQLVSTSGSLGGMMTNLVIPSMFKQPVVDTKGLVIPSMFKQPIVVKTEDKLKVKKPRSRASILRPRKEWSK
jgi:hypothetical protein